MTAEPPICPLPEHLPGAERPGPVQQIRDGEVLIDLPGVARALVRAGTIVGVQPAPDVDPGDLAWLLDGHVRQVAALQGGQFALRASGVVIDGRAVAICAYGAAGASAAAAGLARRGHPVLADGWLPVATPALDVPACTDELALWPDVAQLVGRDPDDGRLVRPGLRKRRHRFAAGDASPLAVVVVLRRFDQEPDVSATRDVGGSALEQLLAHVALNHLVAPLGLAAQRFRWAVELAAGCRVHRLEIDRYHPDVDGPARAIEAMVRG